MADEWDDFADDGANNDPVAENQWAGEDVDDDCLLGDDWEASEDDEKEKKPAVVVERPKVISQRKRAAAAAERRAKAERAAKEMEEDPEAQERKALEARRVVEEADNALANELFNDMAGEVKKVEKENLGIEDFVLTSTKDYESFTNKIIGKLKGKGSVRIEEFVVEVLARLKDELSLDATNTIKSKVNIMANTKMKERQSKKKKKKKPALKMQYDGDFSNDYSLGAGGGAFDDFM